MGAPTSPKPTPLRNSYWVIPGKVLAGEHPVGSSRESTRERLQRLIDVGVECFIDLTEPNEIKAYDRDLPFSIEYLRKPIKDHSTPAQRVHMAEILDCMHDALQSGRCVYVHCRAGIGRTGTVIGCFLVERGLPGESALDELNRLWQHCERSHSWASVPETSDQTDYVLRWKRRGIFDDRGGLTTPDLRSDDEDDLRPSAGPAPWAHLLGNGQSSGNGQSNSTPPRPGPKPPRSPANAAPAASPQSSANASPLAAPTAPPTAGAPRSVIANAARAAARESDSDELLIDPTSVSKLPQTQNSRPTQAQDSRPAQAQDSRPGVPGWIARGSTAAAPALSNNARPLPSATPASHTSSALNAPLKPDSASAPNPQLSSNSPPSINAASPGPLPTADSSTGSARGAAAATASATAPTGTGKAPASAAPNAKSQGSRPAAPQGASPAGERPRESRSRTHDSAGANAPATGNSPATAIAPTTANSGVFQAVADDADVDPLLDPEALAAASNLRGRFLGALVGLAVGDAVAAATQYRRPGSFTPVGDMLGGGPFDLPRGGWSDDTAMALCLADSLLDRNGFDARDQMEKYRRWQQQGYLSATGQCVGITASTARAIAMAQWRRQALFGSHDPSQQDPEPLSRVASAVLFFFATSGEAVNQATEAARTTCQAPAVLEACRALARALYAALRGQPKATVLEKAALAVTTPAVLAGTGPANTATATSAGGSSTVTAQRVGSTAPAALAAAVAAFGATDNFRDAILYAANLGGDSDVVAAVCGQLAGAYYSVKAIPTSWYNGLMQKELITGYADRLLAHAMVGLGG